MVDQTPSMPPMPDVDLRMQIPYESIRYVAGFTEEYVKQYAVAYAQAVADERVRAATTFQPIQSAPKDGTEIWAFNGEQGRMHWTEGEVAGGKWALWVWADQVLADVDPEPHQPTHWMPLPPVPTLSLGG